MGKNKKASLKGFNNYIVEMIKDKKLNGDNVPLEQQNEYYTDLALLNYLATVSVHYNKFDYGWITKSQTTYDYTNQLLYNNRDLSWYRSR